jgi:hypothetical protein
VNDPDEQQLSDKLPTPLTDDHKKALDGGSHRRWFLQVSSSPEQSEAIKLVAALKAKGYRAYVVPALVRGGVWHRVRLGPLSTEAEARALRNRIVSTEQLRDAFIGREAPMVAPANRLKEPIPQAKPAASNPAAPQRINPVELSVLASASREASENATPRDQALQSIPRRRAEKMPRLSELSTLQKI